MAQPVKITSRIRLRDFDPDYCGGLEKDETRDKTRKLCERIGELQKLLSNNRVVLLKFFLHISKEEQAERFRERLDNPTKHWKFSVADLKMRERWNDFQRAYEDAINQCSTKHAPWHVVPANRKWFRDYVVASA